jgi:drug/metabolite transporter (DMT)-like permease
MTIVANNLIQSQAILLLIGKVFMGRSVTFLEAGGAIIAFGGAILCSDDGASSSDGVSPRLALLGDIIAVGAGFSGLLYLIFAQTSRLHFSLLMLMFLTIVAATILIVLFQVFVVGETVTFDMHPAHGLAGFLAVSRFDRLPLELINVVVW